MADILGIYNHVQNAGAAGRAQYEKRQIGSSLGRLLSGGDRNAEMQNIAKINPDAALTTGKFMGQMDDQRMERLGKMAGWFVGLPADQKAAMYPQIAAEAQALNFPVPGDYRPEMDEAISRLAQQFAGGAGGVQSTQIGDDGYFYTVDRSTGKFVNSGVKASPNLRVMEQEGQLPYGVVTGRGAPGSVIGLGGGQQQAPQQQAPQQAPQTRFTGPDGVPVSIDPSLPPEVQAAIRGNPQAWAQAPDQSQANIGPQPAAQPQQLPPALDYQRGGQVGPVRIPTAAEQAAAKAAAERSVALQFAPAEAKAAADQARLVDEAKADVTKAAGQPKARLALDQATARMQRVDALVDSILPRVSAATSGFIGGKLSGIQGTPAHDLQRDLGTLQAIAGFDELNAMRAASPTGGALGNVTERELAFLQSVVRNIENSQSPEQLRRNVEAFRDEIKGTWSRVREAYEKDFGGNQSPQTGSPQGNRRRFNPATGRIE